MGAVAVDQCERVLEVDFFEHRDRGSGDWHHCCGGSSFSQRTELLVEACRIYSGSLIEGKHTTHEIGQFANVTGPGMFLELLYKIGIQQRRFCASFGGEFIGKVPGERGNILDPIAKTRDGKRNNVQPVVQIAAELALFHHRAEGRVGGGNDTDVDMNGPGLAEPLELALLKDPQQLGLQVERHLAYFVKQEGTAVRQLEFASFGGVSAGEGPLGVAE